MISNRFLRSSVQTARVSLEYFSSKRTFSFWFQVVHSFEFIVDEQ